VLEDNGLVSQIDSQFVFDTEKSCRTVESLVHDKYDDNNCKFMKVPSNNNDAIDNLNLLITNKGDNV